MDFPFFCHYSSEFSIYWFNNPDKQDWPNFAYMLWIFRTEMHLSLQQISNEKNRIPKIQPFRAQAKKQLWLQKIQRINCAI
jgi:hypothetical protein